MQIQVPAPPFAEAMEEFREGLRLFSINGFKRLREDLELGVEVRGSWTGCPLSYKEGAPGSARRDRLGRASNSFTVRWDNGWITCEEALHVVCEEQEVFNLLRESVDIPEFVTV